MRVVLLADGMAVVRMRVPGETPAAVDVAVVVAQEEVHEAREPGRERDIGERAADEVVPVRVVPGPSSRVVEPIEDGGTVDQGGGKLALCPDGDGVSLYSTTGANLALGRRSAAD